MGLTLCFNYCSWIFDIGETYLILRRCCVPALLTIWIANLIRVGWCKPCMWKLRKVSFLKLNHVLVFQGHSSISVALCVSSTVLTSTSKSTLILCLWVCLFFGWELYLMFLTYFLLLLLPAVQLLQKLSITAVGKHEKLLRAIKNPVSRYLPVNSQKIVEVNVVWFFLCYLFCTRNEVNICFDTRLIT